jgi:hypothetical protein
MHDAAIARLQSTRAQTPLYFKCNVLRESLSAYSQNIPSTTLKRTGNGEPETANETKSKGVDNQTVKWIESRISNRTQNVNIQGEKSESCDVDSGAGVGKSRPSIKTP